MTNLLEKLQVDFLYEVEEAYFHPNYRAPEFYYDIVILKVRIDDDVWQWASKLFLPA